MFLDAILQGDPDEIPHRRGEYFPQILMSLETFVALLRRAAASRVFVECCL